MSLEVLSANEKGIVVRGNRDGRIWKFLIERRGDVRVLVETDDPDRDPHGGALPEVDYPAVYRFASDEAAARELVDAPEGE